MFPAKLFHWLKRLSQWMKIQGSGRFQFISRCGARFQFCLAKLGPPSFSPLICSMRTLTASRPISLIGLADMGNEMFKKAIGYALAKGSCFNVKANLSNKSEKKNLFAFLHFRKIISSQTVLPQKKPSETCPASGHCRYKSWPYSPPHLPGVDAYVFNASSLIGISDMHHPVGRLDHRRIGEFPFLAFQRHYRLPVFTAGGNSQV